MTYLHEAKAAQGDGEDREDFGLDPLIESGLYVDGTWVGRRRASEVVFTAPETPEGLVYDLASITKPFTASVALWCVSRGRLDLGEAVFPDRFVRPPRLGDLLRHLSGAVAWSPLYLGGARGSLIPENSALWGGPRGVYSDVGYLTAARWIEQRLERSLLELLTDFVAEELDGVRLEPSPFPRLLGQTELDVGLVRPSPCSTAKEVELASAQGLVIEDLGPPEPGEPQDGNARWLSRRGLLAGHAGLFGTALAVSSLMARWVRAARGGDDALDREFRSALVPIEGRLLGWQRPPSEWALPSHLFGHFGFTGGAVWGDPRLDTSMVLLAHRADPRSDLEPSRRAVAQVWHRWAQDVEGAPEPLVFDW